MYNITNLIEGNKLKKSYFEELSKSLYYTTGLSVQLLDSDSHVIYQYGQNTFDQDMFPDLLRGYAKHIYKTQAKSTNGVSPFKTIYGFSFLAAVISNEHHYFGSLLIGPVLLEPITEHMINNALNTAGLPLTRRSNLKSRLEHLSLLSHPRTYYLCQMVHNLIASNVCVSFDMFQPPADIEIETVLKDIKPFDNAANYNYGLERLFISKVVSGDVDSVKKLFNDQIRTHYFVNLGLDQLRPIKNNGIMFSTLLARAAIKGGLEPDLALSLADQYTNRIEDIYRYSELLGIIEHMTIDFTEHVLQISEVSHVSVVKKVTKYIHTHLSESIRLNDVAEYVDLSPNYFSSLFKREMGIAFADYLNQIRIKESQYLLETTDYPIAEIAVATGFNNQNYFTTIFRKHTGTTPKQYRMKASIK